MKGNKKADTACAVLVCEVAGGCAHRLVQQLQAQQHQHHNSIVHNYLDDGCQVASARAEATARTTSDAAPSWLYVFDARDLAS
jgi:hypothetical protein